MADEVLLRDQNHITVIGAITDDANQFIRMLRVDPVTNRVLVSLTGAGSGSVTSVSVVSDNGFAGSVATATTTPAITLSTTITGLLQGNGTAISAVIIGTGLSFIAGTLSATGSGLTVGTSTIASGTTTRILYDNAGVLGEYVISGTGNVAMTTSPVFTTPSIGVATATSINGLAITSSTGTLTVVNGKTLTINKSITLEGTDSTVMTFPTTSASIARTDAGQTFTGVSNATSWNFTTPVLGIPTSGTLTNCTGLPAASVVAGTLGTGAYVMDTKLTVPQVITTANAIAASGNAATVPVTSKNNIVTNNSAATLTITLTTASAVNMQQCVLQILDFSAVAQTLTLVNTENSTVSSPANTNGSTTLPLTIGFIFNSATSKWRVVATA